MISSSINIYRGAKETFPFTVDGKHDDRKLYFTVKLTKKITNNRIVDLKNTAAGGSDTEITALYNATTDTTLINVFLLPTHTDSLTTSAFYFDIDSVNAANAEDSIPVVYGKFSVQGDVRTPFDGIINAGDLDYLIAVVANSLQEGQYVRVVNNNGAFTFEGSFIQGLFEIDYEGNIQDSGLTNEDDYFEIVNNEITIKV